MEFSGATRDMPKPPPTWLRALGSNDLPPSIRAGGQQYRLLRPFKHDFFAATGLYEGAAGKVVLKVGRTASLFGMPTHWIGGVLARHEGRLYQMSESVEGVPRFVGWWGKTGLVHEYVEGRPLAKEDRLADGFFPRLARMLEELHRREIAYVDLEKRENVLLGDDGSPYLIDFQISWHVPPNRGGRIWICRLILDILQRSDRYHLMKHWRRLRPDQLDGKQFKQAITPPFWIRWHRAVFRPMTHARRWVLMKLGARSSTKGRSPG